LLVTVQPSSTANRVTATVEACAPITIVLSAFHRIAIFGEPDHSLALNTFGRLLLGCVLQLHEVIFIRCVPDIDLCLEPLSALLALSPVALVPLLVARGAERVPVVVAEASGIRNTGRGAQGVRLIKTGRGGYSMSASLLEVSSEEEGVELVTD
jgi:hypothetical protein